jgi:hypothetical protein
MNSNSRTTGVIIEEAKNYDSLNESKQSRDDHLKSILRNKSGDKKLNSQDSIKDEPSKLSQKPVSKFDEIPIEVDDEEYPDDDFEASSGSEMLAKVSVSQSGRLPPLSSSYPYVATQKSLTGSFFADSATKVGESKEAKRDKSQPRNQPKSSMMARNDSLNALYKQQDSIVNVSES